MNLTRAEEDRIAAAVAWVLSGARDERVDGFLDAARLSDDHPWAVTVRVALHAHAARAVLAHASETQVARLVFAAQEGPLPADLRHGVGPLERLDGAAAMARTAGLLDVSAPAGPALMTYHAALRALVVTLGDTVPDGELAHVAVTEFGEIVRETADVARRATTNRVTQDIRQFVGRMLGEFSLRGAAGDAAASAFGQLTRGDDPESEVLREAFGADGAPAPALHLATPDLGPPSRPDEIGARLEDGWSGSLSAHAVSVAARTRAGWGGAEFHRYVVAWDDVRRTLQDQVRQLGECDAVPERARRRLVDALDVAWTPRGRRKRASWSLAPAETSAPLVGRAWLTTGEVSEQERVRAAAMARIDLAVDLARGRAAGSLKGYEHEAVIAVRRLGTARRLLSDWRTGLGHRGRHWEESAARLDRLWEDLPGARPGLSDSGAWAQMPARMAAAADVVEEVELIQTRVRDFARAAVDRGHVQALSPDALRGFELAVAARPGSGLALGAAGADPVGRCVDAMSVVPMQGVAGRGDTYRDAAFFVLAASGPEENPLWTHVADQYVLWNDSGTPGQQALTGARQLRHADVRRNPGRNRGAAGRRGGAQGADARPDVRGRDRSTEL